MVYEPTQWKAGDTVTSAKLNKIEQGIAGAGGANILVAHGTMSQESGKAGTYQVITLDVTLGEILNANFTILQFDLAEDITYSFITNIYHDQDNEIYQIFSSAEDEFIAETEEDYPTMTTKSLPSGDTTPTA